jgi:hypothetical protein
LREVLRTEEALFFACEGGEDYGGAGFVEGEDAGEFEGDGYA